MEKKKIAHQVKNSLLYESYNLIINLILSDSEKLDSPEIPASNNQPFKLVVTLPTLTGNIVVDLPPLSDDEYSFY